SSSGSTPASTNARMPPACMAPKLPPPERAKATFMHQLLVVPNEVRHPFRSSRRPGSVLFRAALSGRSFGNRPQCGLTVVDLHHAVELERPQMGHGLAHGSAAHEPCDVVPRTGP